MDTRSARVVVLDEQAATWTLDVCRNTWEKVRTTGSSPPAGATLVYDLASDLTYAFGDLEVRTYDSRTSTWTLVGDTAADLAGLVGWDWWVLDPGRHAVLFPQRSTGEIRGYDLSTHRWFAVEQQRPRPLPGLDALAVWDPTVGHMVLYIPYVPMGGASATTRTPSTVYDAQTWTFDPTTGAWARVSTSTPVMLFGYFPWGTERAYDAASGKSVVLSTGALAAFDAAASTWTVASHSCSAARYGPTGPAGATGRTPGPTGWARTRGPRSFRSSPDEAYSAST